MTMPQTVPQIDMTDRQKLKQYVLEHGCYSPEENERIYNNKATRRVDDRLGRVFKPV